MERELVNTEEHPPYECACSLKIAAQTGPRGLAHCCDTGTHTIKISKKNHQFAFSFDLLICTFFILRNVSFFQCSSGYPCVLRAINFLIFSFSYCNHGLLWRSSFSPASRPSKSFVTFSDKRMCNSVVYYSTTKAQKQTEYDRKMKGTRGRSRTIS